MDQQIEDITFEDLFERTADELGWYANAMDGSDLQIMVAKEVGVESEMFMRRIIKPGKPEENKSVLVARLNNVYLYVTDDNKFIMTTNGELR